MNKDSEKTKDRTREKSLYLTCIFNLETCQHKVSLKVNF